MQSTREGARGTLRSPGSVHPALEQNGFERVRLGPSQGPPFPLGGHMAAIGGAWPPAWGSERREDTEPLVTWKSNVLRSEGFQSQPVSQISTNDVSAHTNPFLSSDRLKETKPSGVQTPARGTVARLSASTPRLPSAPTPN